MSSEYSVRAGTSEAMPFEPACLVGSMKIAAYMNAW
jgi:hypothetical protein